MRASQIMTHLCESSMLHEYIDESGIKYQYCFTGDRIVNWLESQADISSRAEGIRLLQMLLQHDFIAPIGPNASAQFRDNHRMYAFVRDPKQRRRLQRKQVALSTNLQGSRPRMRVASWHAAELSSSLESLVEKHKHKNDVAYDSSSSDTDYLSFDIEPSHPVLLQAWKNIKSNNASVLAATLPFLETHSALDGAPSDQSVLDAYEDHMFCRKEPEATMIYASKNRQEENSIVLDFSHDYKDACQQDTSNAMLQPSAVKEASPTILKTPTNSNLIHDKQTTNSFQQCLAQLLYLSIQADADKCIDYLLTCGVTVNSSLNSQGDCLLHKASVSNNKTVAAALLRLGANIEQCNDVGSTPLFCAAEKEENHECCILLVENGASIRVKNVAGKRPIDLQPSLAEVQRCLCNSISYDLKRSDDCLQPLQTLARLSKNPETHILLCDNLREKTLISKLSDLCKQRTDAVLLIRQFIHNITATTGRGLLEEDILKTVLAFLELGPAVREVCIQALAEGLYLYPNQNTDFLVSLSKLHFMPLFNLCFTADMDMKQREIWSTLFVLLTRLPKARRRLITDTSAPIEQLINSIREVLRHISNQHSQKHTNQRVYHKTEQLVQEHPLVENHQRNNQNDMDNMQVVIEFNQKHEAEERLLLNYLIDLVSIIANLCHDLNAHPILERLGVTELLGEVLLCKYSSLHRIATLARTLLGYSGKILE